MGAACSPQPAPQPVLVPTVDEPSTTAPTTSAAPVLPTNCAAMIPGNQLDATVGTAISATVNHVIGEPIPNIGRTGRSTCSYGTPVGGVYPLEISLSSYGDAAQAAARVTATVTDGEQQGIGSTAVPAGGVDASYIPLPTGGLVVAAAGIYAVAVTMAPSLVPANQVAAKAAAIAGTVLAGAGV